MSEKLKARIILESARSSTKSFFDAFDKVRQARGATTGAPTDEEQDLLRASLVFAAVGLDSMLKQLVRVAIGRLAQKDPKVQAELETFVQRRLRGDSEDHEALSSHKFLAGVLVSARAAGAPHRGVHSRTDRGQSSVGRSAPQDSEGTRTGSEWNRARCAAAQDCVRGSKQDHSPTRRRLQNSTRKPFAAEPKETGS